MTTVSSGQTFTVSSGQNTTGDVVLNGGTEIVLSGGTATNTMVNSGGLLVVSSGATVNVPNIASGGAIEYFSGAGAAAPNYVPGSIIEFGSGTTPNAYQVISGRVVEALSGAHMTNTVVSSGTLMLFGGATAIGTDVRSQGVIEAVSGYTLSNYVVSNSSTEAVGPGGFDSGTVVQGGGTQLVLSGGIASATDVQSGGTQRVTFGGSANGTTIEAFGSSLVSAGGTVSGTVISGLGTLMLFGGASATAIDLKANGLIEAVSGYTLSNFVVSNSGTEAVGPGGSDIGTVVQSGGSQLSISGGVATSAVIQNGAVQSVTFSGSAVSTTIQGGGSSYVASGGQVSGTTVSSGGYLGVSVDGSIGARASGTIVSRGGVEEVGDHGSDGGAVISSGGFQQVDIGAVAAGATVFSGGTQLVINGTVINTTLSGGSQTITSGGTASATTISAGGSMTVGATASAAAPRISSGGHVVVSSGGWIQNPSVLSGGTLELAAGAITSDSTILSFNPSSPPGKTLIIHGTSMPGATTQITNVSAGDVIDLTDAVFASGGTVHLLSGSKLEVVESSVTFDLQLSSQDFSGVTFNVGADSGTGTRVFVDRAPTTTTTGVSGTHGHSIAAASLFSATDPDGESPTNYALWDTQGNGHWVVNGVTQATNAEIDITAAQLAQTSYVFGATASDTLYIRTFDGALWSNWSQFTGTPTDQLPVVSAANFTATHGQTSIAAVSLFSATDADGDSITKYALWDTQGNGHWVVNGIVQATNAEIDITDAQLAQTTYVFGSAADTLSVKAFDGVAWGNWKNFTATPGPNQAPMVTATPYTAVHLQPFAPAGSLFSITDVDHDTITKYALWDTQGNGHWVVNGITQTTNAEIDISAAQFAQTQYVYGSAPDTLSVKAFDGLAWSAWANFTATPGPNAAPIITAHNFAALSGQSFAAASLFSVTDADNDAITTYALWDSGGNGHWVVNGQAQGASVEIDITAAQLAQTTYVAGAAGTTDTLFIKANDGTVWGNWTSGFTAAVRPASVTHAPVVSVRNATVAPGQSVDMATLVTASDPDGGSIVTYDFWDSNTNGHFQLNLTDQPANQEINVTAAQFTHNRILYFAGTGTDQLYVRVNNGTTWSGWVPFSGGQTTPVVTASNAAIKAGSTVSAASLFTAVDPDVGGGITTYALWDSNSNGHFSVNGAQQNANTEIDLTPTQLAQTTYTGGNGTDQLYVRANNGVGWSGWVAFTASPATPLVTAANATIASGHSVAAGSLFTATDPNANGSGITMYALWDSNTNGHFSINGAQQNANTEIDLSPAQLALTTYTAGTGTDQLYVRANNGVGWSGWVPFTASQTTPVVTASSLTTAPGQVFAAANLFSAVDPDIGGGITTYAFWDSNTNGHFTVNGSAKPAGNEIDVTPVQLAQTTYTAGTGTDQLYVRVNNGVGWSGWMAFTLTGDPAAIINPGATFELPQAYANQVTFFGDTGRLKIDDVTTFAGTVAGMFGSDALDLVNIAFANVHTPQFTGNAAGGTLSVTDGTTTANIALLGNYLSSTFVASNDGHGGTLVVDPQKTG